MTDESAALTALRSEILLRLTELSGDVRLILQRMDQADARTEEHRQALARLDERVDRVEQVTVTRDELEREVARVRADAAEQRQADAETSRRSLMVWGLVVAVLGALLGAGVGVIGLFIR